MPPPVTPVASTAPEQADAWGADEAAAATADRQQRWRVVAAAGIAAGVLIGAVVLLLTSIELPGYQSWLGEMRERR